MVFDRFRRKKEPDFFSKVYIRESFLNKKADKKCQNNKIPLYKKGFTVSALWSEDGNWYDARIEDYDDPSDHYLVTFIEYGNQEWLSPSNIR